MRQRHPRARRAVRRRERQQQRQLPEQLRPIYTKLGIDIPAYNGDDTFVLPVPATYVVDSDGVIRYRFVNVDYTKRLEPEDLLRVLRGQ